MLGVQLVAEVGTGLVLDAAVVVRSGGPEGLPTALLRPDEVLAGAPGLVSAIAGPVGFEATAISRDEARGPDRTVPRATQLALTTIAVFCTVSSWAIVGAWRDTTVIEQSAADPGGIVAATTERYLGTAAADVLTVLLVTSPFGAVLATPRRRPAAADGRLHRARRRGRGPARRRAGRWPGARPAEPAGRPLPGRRRPHRRTADLIRETDAPRH